MNKLRLVLLASALGALIATAVPARAAVSTQGSALSLPISVQHFIRSQQDWLAWIRRLAGFRDASSGFIAPADGQVTEIRLKGTAIQPLGAAPPLTEIHFQSLDTLSDGTKKVYLSSAPFQMPVNGDPNQVTTYRPENLCIHQGGTVAFNTEGGWDGTDPGQGPYSGGVIFLVLADQAASATDWFTRHNGTMNNAVVAPPSTLDGEELQMQWTLATGDDRSYDCGGPLRDPNGQIHQAPAPDTKPKMHVILPQEPYVQSDGRLAIGVFCHSATGCQGTATLDLKDKPIASSPFDIPAEKSFRIPMRISRRTYRRLRRARHRRLSTAFLLDAGAVGAFTETLTIRH